MSLLPLAKAFLLSAEDWRELMKAKTEDYTA
jgi:hypothetical protein